nr:MAG TPA: hypothetical protein [Myoviridae sp. ctNPX13]
MLFSWTLCDILLSFTHRVLTFSSGELVKETGTPLFITKYVFCTHK